MPSVRRSRPLSQDAHLPRIEACADAVLDVVPGVMDALRGAMRLSVGDQLSVPQFRCLAFVAREPGCSISAIASFLGVTLPTASAMVDRLVRSGAVEAEPDPADRRRARLRLTAAGKTQLAEIRRGARDELKRVLSSREGLDLRQLLAGLAVLRQAFQPDAED